MFCDYCRRLFEFRGPLTPYKPPEKRGLGNKRGSEGESLNRPALEQPVIEPQKPAVEVYGDVEDIFAPQILRWKTPIIGEGLRIGATHAPGLDCQVCDMIFSNISPSLVQALLHKNELPNGESSMSFVYELKGNGKGTISADHEAFLAVSLEVDDQLLPMIKLKISHTTNPQSHYLTGEANTTGSKMVLDLAASWLQSCNTHHRKCSHLNSPQYCLPTRLVDVGTKDGSIKPHLWIPGRDAALVPYMTLSYHWLKNPRLLLTKESLPTLCEGIPVGHLPKSIEDAIQITRYLDIRYLWVDALCIIQDDPTDWETESATMGNVYKFSYCTISASSAMNEGEGCFVSRGSLQAKITTSKARAPMAMEPGMFTTKDRHSKRNLPPRRTLPSSKSSPPGCDIKRRRLSKKQDSAEPQQINTPITIQSLSRKDENLSYDSSQEIERAIDGKDKKPPPPPPPSWDLTIRTFQEDLWATEVDTSPLSRRAWTLQERLLSPRLLHFGQRQLFWECKVSKACETWPTPQPKKPAPPAPPAPWAHPRSSRSGPSTAAVAGFGSQELNGMNVDPLHEHWDEIVEAYTDAHLTRSADRLVAIEGLAREVRAGTRDAYYAGHWGGDLMRSLLWYVKSAKRVGVAAYRAPSWSWAAVDGKVSFLVRRGFEHAFLGRVKSVRTVGVDGVACSTGGIEYGFCEVAGRVVDVQRWERQGLGWRLIVTDEGADVGLEGADVEFWPDVMPIGGGEEGVVCLLLVRYTEGIWEKENLGGEGIRDRRKRIVKSYVAGLVLRPTGEYRGEYRRVGLWQGSKGELDVERLEEREERIFTIV